MVHVRSGVVVAGMVALAVALAGCGGGEIASSESEADAPGLRIAFVPKHTNEFFAEMDKGGQAAASEFGFEWLYQGAPSYDAAAQANIVKSFIQQGVDALIVAPNDPDSMVPLLKQAQEKGIKVITADTDSPTDSRSLFVSQATAADIGAALADSLFGAMGESGKYAIVSCSQTAQNLEAWIAAMKKRAQDAYPDVELVDVVYPGGDQTKATTMATDLINANPDLKGLAGVCVPTASAVAQAVENTDKTGKVFTVGVGLPNQMKPYIENGSSSASVLWDVKNLGYLAAWAGVQLAEEKDFQPTNVVGPMSDVVWDESTTQLIMGKPLVLTTDNINDYDF